MGKLANSRLPRKRASKRRLKKAGPAALASRRARTNRRFLLVRA
jgi:hypothetical protein